MARVHLTELGIGKLAHPTSGDVKYWDTVLPGFGVRVTARAKSYFIAYGERRQLKTLGKWPELSLKDARTAAKQAQTIQSPTKGVTTLSEARTAFYADCAERLRPRTLQNYKILLNRIEKERLEDVVRSDVPKDAHAIMAAKVFFNWCIRHELTDRNPFASERVTYQDRSRVLRPEELKLIWQYEDAPFTDHLKLLLLTGQRRSQYARYEIRGDTIWFPAEIMKGKQEHTIPLLPEAETIALALEPFNGWSKSKARMDKAVKIPHWTIHDLRRTFATMNAEIGTPVHVIEKILDHRSGTISGVAAIYNRHSYMQEARLWMGRFEKYLMGIVLSG